MAKLKFFMFQGILETVIANPLNESKLEARIIGGKSARTGQFPYQVSLQDEANFHFCGGSILNEKWILTAAFCINLNENGTVVVGNIDITSKKNLKYTNIKVIPHPEFNNKSYENDLALIKIVDTMQFTRDVQPVKLPEKDMNIPELKVNISGWGLISLEGELTDKLKYLESRVFDIEECIKMWSGKYSPAEKNNHLCTFTSKGQGACTLDAGNPIVANNVQVGIVSMGLSCGKELPDVNTNVWKYVDWIKKTMEEN